VIESCGVVKVHSHSQAMWKSFILCLRILRAILYFVYSIFFAHIFVDFTRCVALHLSTFAPDALP